MTIRCNGFKAFASTVVGALICAVLASCTALAPSDEPGAGSSPDLMVTSPAVTDSGPAAGAPFTLSATVRNAGAEAAVATKLRYYRSPDAEITSSDMEVGTDAVAELAASGTSSESVSLTAPSTAGTYYYGACVDAVMGESDTTNNCSSSSAPAPDQVAAEVAPSPSAAGAGNGEFLVHWIPSGDGGSAITKYQYRVWETGQTAPATWTDISLSDSALTPKTGRQSSMRQARGSPPSTTGTGRCRPDTRSSCKRSIRSARVRRPRPL